MNQTQQEDSGKTNILSIIADLLTEFCDQSTQEIETNKSKDYIR